MKGNLRSLINTPLIVAALVLAALGTGTFVYAADAVLYFSPVTGTYTAETPFTVRVYVNSAGEAVNAIEGKIIYDTKDLEIVSVGDARSVITSWTLAPAIDNDDGTLVFGGLLGTSTVLERGEVLSILARAKRSGEAEFRFDTGSAAVRAADGTGGNVLTSLNRGLYTILPSEDEGAPAGGEVLGAATATPFEISSATHPDQERWYREATTTLTWPLHPDALRVLLGLDRKPEGKATVPYVPPVNVKQITDLEEGRLYFHATQELADGTTVVMHYRLQRDATAPIDLSLTEVTRADPSDPTVIFTVTATDTFSGIERYEFALDGRAPVVWNDGGDHRYTMHEVAPGEHELKLFVTDRAGNRSEISKLFSVAALPPPTIAIEDADASEGEQIALSVDTIPNGIVTVAISRNSEAPVTESFSADEKGKGKYASAFRLAPGEYQVWAFVAATNGARSPESDRLMLLANASLSGIMKRHPMLPIVSASLLFTLVLSFILWRTFRERPFAMTGQAIDDTPDPVSLRETDHPRQRVTPNDAGHTVVLTRKNKRPPIAPTRLG